MSSYRPTIPAETVRQVLIESGHRCAVCGEPCPLERAHIIPWRKSKSHAIENLICLCANCHHRADLENWGEKTLKQYKSQPWIIRKSEIENNLNTPTKFTITLQIEYDNFSTKEERLLIHALAGFLEIPPESIKLLTKEKGSLIVTLELPSQSVKKLSQALQTSDVKLLNTLREFNLIVTKIDKSQTSLKEKLMSEFKVSDFDKDNYDKVWHALNEELRIIENKKGLPAVLEKLGEQQFDQGFIQDDLKSVVVYRFFDDPIEKRNYFSIQYNSKREQRHLGAGRKEPPSGSDAVFDNCFLCRDNVRWQQRGIEFGYNLNVKGIPYIAWMNPFPIMPVHVTIAKEVHELQSWVGKNSAESERKIETIVDHLLEITSRLPDFIGFYNGDGAGASIPHHFHFQFFKRPRGRELFPLEIAATKPMKSPPALDYPIAAIHFQGEDVVSIIKEASDFVHEWTLFYDNNPALSANIIACLDMHDQKKFHLYFIPRNKYVSRAAGMVGMIGGVEVLGELVFSTEGEKARLDSRDLDFSIVGQIIGAVEPPGVQEFLRILYFAKSPGVREYLMKLGLDKQKRGTIN